MWTRRTRIADDHRKRDPWRNLFKLWDSWQLSDRHFYAIIYVLLLIVELNRHISFITVKRRIWTDNPLVHFLSEIARNSLWRVFTVKSNLKAKTIRSIVLFESFSFIANCDVSSTQYGIKRAVSRLTGREAGIDSGKNRH